MTVVPKRPIKIFYSYAPADKEMRDKLDSHLTVLRREDRIIVWHDLAIQPGTERRREIDKHLSTSDIILLLISHNFLASDHCYEQMRRALELHNTRKIRVIPIILSPVEWKKSPIGGLQSLPRGEKSITQYENQDEVFLEIVKEIDKVVSGLIEWIDLEIIDLIQQFNVRYFQMEVTEKDWINETANRMILEGNYLDAINKIKALTEDASSIWWAHELTPAVLFFIEEKVSQNYLKQIKRAFRMIFGYRGHDEFDDFRTYYIDLTTSRYTLARMAYIRTMKSLQENPNNAKALYIQSIALIGLGKNQQALTSANQVQSLDPYFPGIYDLKCTILAHLGRISEALDALEHAKHLNQNEADDYNRVKAALNSLRKPAKWLQMTLPPQTELLAISQLAESLFLSQGTEEGNIGTFGYSI